MPGHTLFLTGHLAEKRLRQVLGALDDLDFSWSVQDIGLQVAALMTTDLIHRRLSDKMGADRILVPGHCRGDLGELGAVLGVPIERGPVDLHDLPQHFGQIGESVDLSARAVGIFAEIVEAPTLSVEAILEKARRFAADGADVIDLGCLPATPFPQMEDAIAALHEAGFQVSVDFLLSLSEETLTLAEETAAVPVVIPAKPGDLDSILRAVERLERGGRPFILDSILDPIPFGFAASILRYAELRRRLPQARILMGIGNVTELTDADTTGVNALLFGIIAELAIDDVLVVQVSPHCRRAIREADRARRLMHAASRLERLPIGIDTSLMALRDRRPFTSTSEEIAETAAQIRDLNFRIEVASDGIHIYNRAQHRVAAGAFDLFSGLGVENDGAHAFYLGVELARAEIAWQLGKRYVQDQPLQWGSAVDLPPLREEHRAPGPTLQARAKRRRDKR
jgi:dihydropteroate synthase